MMWWKKSKKQINPEVLALIMKAEAIEKVLRDNGLEPQGTYFPSFTKYTAGSELREKAAAFRAKAAKLQLKLEGNV